MEEEIINSILILIRLVTSLKLFTCIRKSPFDNHGFGHSRKATEDFILFIEEYDPDIINLHNVHGYYLNIEILIRIS